ncbi:unnamed protein product [Hyaloperonospora brassicae]|uniref:RxLR effector candidate protein n=1 Tax=Hyaloperonospora brassicae TaxID=162125 RepID=A0AAV0UHG6_HYABA|nr:unnamed protein product [Hyaloperonospora brassicae]
MRSSIFVIALLMSGVLLVTADAVSASRRLKATASGAEKLVDEAPKEVARVPLPDVEGLEERWNGPVSWVNRFVEWIKSFMVDLRSLYFRHHIPAASEDYLTLLLKTYAKDPHHTFQMATAMLRYRSLFNRGVNARLVEDLDLLLSHDACVRIVTINRFISLHPSAYTTVVEALRRHLGELEVAILITRAKQVQPYAVHVEELQFEAWKAKAITPEQVLLAFSNGGPLLSESSAFAAPSPYIFGDFLYIDRIVSDYKTYLGNKHVGAREG